MILASMNVPDASYEERNSGRDARLTLLALIHAVPVPTWDESEAGDPDGFKPELGTSIPLSFLSGPPVR